jgi:hypothetical protein
MNAVNATQESTTFGRKTSVSVKIDAKPEIVWSLLTNAKDFPRWNTTVKNVEGKISLGEKIKLRVFLDEKRVFNLKITEFKPATKMVWEDGVKPFFKGIRTYQLNHIQNNSTEFKMDECMFGLMFPMAAKHIPDFRKSFEQYASDLKKEAEAQVKQK